jgi:hypothetical protein
VATRPVARLGAVPGFAATVLSANLAVSGVRWRAPRQVVRTRRIHAESTDTFCALQG